MDFSQIQARTESLCRLEGWSDTSPAPDYADLANQALQLFSWHAEYVTGDTTVLTVVDQAEYDLLIDPDDVEAPPGPDWKLVTDCLYNGTQALTATDENILRRNDPAWMSVPSGQPGVYWITRPNTLRLHPAPNTANIVVTVRGIRVDGPLVEPGDKPTCADVFHEGIALLGAWLHGKQYATGEAMARVTAYYTEGLRYADECRLYQVEQSAPSLQRAVAHRARPRTSFGWI